MVEPIQRVIGPSGTLDGVAGVHRLLPIDRDERPPDRDRQQQRRRRPEPEPGIVEQGADGRPHVDVRA